MRTITTDEISQLVADLCRRANFHLPEDVVGALERAREVERSQRARWVLDSLLENAAEASRESLPLCQDTGLVVCFVRLGSDARIEGDLAQAVDAGVRRAYTTWPLRKSLLADPLDRASNTGDNTPAVLSLELVEGDGLEIQVVPKGGGSENAGAAWMLSPGEGEEGLVARIERQVREQGGKWCPPGIVGVGVGGTLERAAELAKRAVTRPIGSAHAEAKWAALEARLLRTINATGLGPMGLGGDTTALAAHVEYYPCHLASLPVAVNFQCHAARRAAGRL